MLGPGWTSRLLQAVLVELLTDPAAIAAVTRARSTYAMRSLAVRAGLAGQGVVSTPGDGINAWIEVEDERAALLRDDVVISMPPHDLWLRGIPDVIGWIDRKSVV